MVGTMREGVLRKTKNGTKRRECKKITFSVTNFLNDHLPIFKTASKLNHRKT